MNKHDNACAVNSSTALFPMQIDHRTSVSINQLLDEEGARDFGLGFFHDNAIARAGGGRPRDTSRRISRARERRRRESKRERDTHRSPEIASV